VVGEWIGEWRVESGAVPTQCTTSSSLYKVEIRVDMISKMVVKKNINKYIKVKKMCPYDI